PVTGDNCGVASVVNNHASNIYPVGTTTVTWTVTDIHGNQSTATQIITVTDNEVPTITAPVNISVNNTAGICEATVALGTPVTGDNCGVASVVNDHASNVYPVGTTTVTWTVTDIHGNTNTTTQLVTVTDNEQPTISIAAVSVNNDLGACSATVNIGTPVTGDNCGVASVVNDHTSNVYPVGTTTVTWTVTDIHSNTNSITQLVTVTDNEKPVITAPLAQVNCANADGSTAYSIPAASAADNCGVASQSYAITGATTRGGTGYDAGGVFNIGVSTITWTVTDVHGNTSTSTTTVTINPLPVAGYTTSNADAFCNQLTITASSSITPATYQWFSGSSTFANTQSISLGQTNGDGIYSVKVTDATTGCVSATAATYNFQKQTLASSYTILALEEVELGAYNKVNSGSVGVISAKGEAEFRSNSSVNSPGSFVKARKIESKGSNILITTPILSAATGITLPTMYYNTASTSGLSNKEVAKNSITTVSGNYKNLTLKKGSRTTLTGSVYGAIKVEQGAQVTFTQTTINIGKLHVVKGPRVGYSYVHFADGAKVLIGESVNIGSQVYINPDNNNVTFYVSNKKKGDHDEEGDGKSFKIHGGDTRVTANIYMPGGKLKVKGGYGYGDYGKGKGDSDKEDDDEKDYGNGNSYVYMTGLFIAKEVESEGKNVIWNSFDCSSTPVPLVNTTTVAQSVSIEKTEQPTTEEELKVTVMPNPSSTYFTIKLESKYETPVNMRVLDAGGRVIDAKTQIGSNSTIQVGHGYSSGTYFAELLQGSRRKVVQLVKARG
ncbi:MAG: HYR domain-containing protein, partial [Sediminibacterium sp.]|nr:HYR domain-containing protein [Sediminibacterium sp.]